MEKYAEKFEEKWNPEVRDNVLKLLLSLPNLKLVHPSYRWKLIVADLDNNKFVACALAAQADFIVTEDKHFSELRNIPFPNVEAVGIDAFIKLLEEV